MAGAWECAGSTEITDGAWVAASLGAETACGCCGWPGCAPWPCFFLRRRRFLELPPGSGAGVSTRKAIRPPSDESEELLSEGADSAGAASSRETGAGDGDGSGEDSGAAAGAGSPLVFAAGLDDLRTAGRFFATLAAGASGAAGLSSFWSLMLRGKRPRHAPASSVKRQDAAESRSRETQGPETEPAARKPPDPNYQFPMSSRLSLCLGSGLVLPSGPQDQTSKSGLRASGASPER